VPFRPRDEMVHAPADPVDPSWEEAWYFDLVAGDGLVCAVQLVVPVAARCRYWACLVGADGPADLVAVVDDDVPSPKGASMELRTDGLWADHIVETAFDHVSVGCEAFALRVDPPLDLSFELVGERVPFGLDLGWETAGDVMSRTAGDVQGYEVPCLVYGEILLSDGRIVVDAAPGRRGHLWGLDGRRIPRWLTSSALPEAIDS
jgi:hypothetical protein